MRPQYLVSPRGDNGLNILHVASYSYVGRITVGDGKYSVQNDQDDEIAVVNSVDDAIPALLHYYEKHPPRWEADGKTAYCKSTQFGDLRVEQDHLGRWLASRNDGYHLLRDGTPALFPTAEVAKRTADAHLADNCPNSVPVSDGFSWLHDPLLELWSDPYG